MILTIQRLCAITAWLTFASAQTILSTVPVINGNTEVLSISTDLTGNTVPVVIGTLSDPGAPAATPGVSTTPIPVPGVTTTPLASTTVAAATTPTSSTPRVVGQPGPTNAEPGPTVYTYFTTDANGQPTQVVDTFTPSYVPATTGSYTPKAGTVIPYDQYTSVYGGGSSGGGSAASNSAPRQSAAFGLGAATVMCVLGGITLLL